MPSEADAAAEADERYTLYQYAACPYCALVRDFLADRGIVLPLRDTMQDAAAFRELLVGGGRATVPCLRIDGAAGTRWLYESADIMRYLDERQGAA